MSDFFTACEARVGNSTMRELLHTMTLARTGRLKSLDHQWHNIKKSKIKFFIKSYITQLVLNNICCEENHDLNLSPLTIELLQKIFKKKIIVVNTIFVIIL